MGKYINNKGSYSVMLNRWLMICILENEIKIMKRLKINLLVNIQDMKKRYYYRKRYSDHIIEVMWQSYINI